MDSRLLPHPLPPLLLAIRLDSDPYCRSILQVPQAPIRLMLLTKFRQVSLALEHWSARFQAVLSTLEQVLNLLRYLNHPFCPLQPLRQR